MALVRNENFVRLLLMKLMTVVATIVVLGQLLVSCIKKGPWSLFHVEPRHRQPDISRSKRFGIHGFAQFEEVCLHYVANGTKGKPLILFLHGFPELWYSWRLQLEHFGKDYYAVAYDMRGYGESTKPKDIRLYGVDKLVEDVKKMIEYLGYEKCVLVSHDWGGAVAWCFALLHPEMLDKLIVCNCPHPSAMHKYLNSSKSQLWRSRYMMFFQVPCLPEFFMRANDLEEFKSILKGGPGAPRDGTFTSEDIEVFLHAYTKKGAFTGPINYYRARFQYGQPLFHSKVVDTPTLVIWGTGDAFLETPMASLSMDYCPNGSVKYISNASHWVQQEEPQLVNQHISEFLTSKSE